MRLVSIRGILPAGVTRRTHPEALDAVASGDRVHDLAAVAPRPMRRAGTDGVTTWDSGRPGVEGHQLADRGPCGYAANVGAPLQLHTPGVRDQVRRAAAGYPFHCRQGLLL
jgi:hypothetical protein